MKKLICMICILAMVLSLAACGQADKPAEPSGTTAPTTSESSPTEPSVPVEPTEPSKPAETIPENPTPPSEDNAEENEEAIPTVTEPDKEDEQPSEPAEPTVPSESVEPSKPAEKPSKPTKPSTPTTKPSEPTTKPTTPTNPPKEDDKNTPPKPAGCAHKNTKFVEDIEPPTCMEYGYLNATICADCGELLDYENRYWHSTGDSMQLPTEHICIMDDLNYVEPTPTTEGYSGDRGCYRCGTIFEKGHVLPKLPYFVRLEVVSEYRPHASIVDGQDLLTRMFGKYNAYQIDDEVTLRVVMSDGGSTGFEIHPTDTVSYEVEGNLIHMTFHKHPFRYESYNQGICVKSLDENGEVVWGSHIADYFFNMDRRFVEDECMDMLLRTYGQFRGLRWEGSGPDCATYTEHDKSLSLTGCTIIGSDDHFYVAGNPNWVSEVLWLVDQYVAMGFNEWHFMIWYKGGFGCSSGYDPQWA